MSMYQTYLHEHVVLYNSAIADKLYNSVITNIPLMSCSGSFQLSILIVKSIGLLCLQRL